MRFCRNQFFSTHFPFDRLTPFLDTSFKSQPLTRFFVDIALFVIFIFSCLRLVDVLFMLEKLSKSSTAMPFKRDEELYTEKSQLERQCSRCMVVWP